MEVPRLGAGRFEVRGTLGTGGAGVVYRAFDQPAAARGRAQAPAPRAGRDLYRFKREFRALADIVHPNLVTLHELHAAEGDWFFTMELVEGVSFIDWVRPSRTTSGPARTRQDILGAPVHEVRLRAALVQLVDALIALHKAGKLHRDLKPSNVLVDAAGAARAARLRARRRRVAEDNPEKLAVGTPVYMSPEQASDQPLTEASDWYSVGAMLYEALTGRRPFEGESEQVMTRKQTEMPPTPLRGPRRRCPPTSRSSHAAARAGAERAPDRPGDPRCSSARRRRRATRDMARTAMPATFVGRRRELDELAPRARRDAGAAASP